uniref:BPTI/Kunitz inhibitor domain-containing protein n=1 Tax=Sphaeramia orbicularis TaxID=375764 RepID=A0A673B5K1_9TELE
FKTIPYLTGPCRAYFRRYYYDTNSKTCKVFIYGGCKGNLNNFETMSKCLQTCQPEGEKWKTNYFFFFFFFKFIIYVDDNLQIKSMNWANYS